MTPHKRHHSVTGKEWLICALVVIVVILWAVDARLGNGGLLGTLFR